MYKLIIKDDEGNKTVVAFYRQEITVGRREGNTIRLTEQNVSRDHARFFKTNNLIYVEDQQSYVGTYVNDNMITERIRLQNGDSVKIGDYIISLFNDEQGDDNDTILTTETSSETLNKTSQSQKIKPVPISEITGAKTTTHTAIIHTDDIKPNVPEQLHTLKPPFNKIVFLNQNFDGITFEINKSVMIIGRGPETDILINHRSISENHAQLSCDGNSVKIRDLGSSNGTLINNEKYGISELNEGDIVTIGHVKFRFCDKQSNYHFIPTKSDSGGSKLPVIIVAVVIIIALLGGGGYYFMNQNKKENSTKENDKDNIKENKDIIKDNNNTENKDNTDVVKEEKVLSPQLLNLLGSGDKLIKDQNWEKAKNIYEKVLEEDSENEQAKKALKLIEKELENKKIYMQVVQLLHKKDFLEAITTINTIPEESNYYIQVHKKLDTSFEDILKFIDESIGKRQYEVADTLLSSLIELKPENENITQRINYLNKQYKKKNTTNKTIKTDVKTETKDETKTDVKVENKTDTKTEVKVAKYDRATAEKLTKDAQSESFANPNSAYKKINEAIKADPSYPSAYRVAGIVCKNLGKNKEAIVYLEKYLKLSPNEKDSAQIRKTIDDLKK